MADEKTYIMIKVSAFRAAVVMFAWLLRSSLLHGPHSPTSRSWWAQQPTSYLLLCPARTQPDGVQRGLVGDIIKRFEQRGYTLKGLKLMNVERALAEKHYADLSSKPFFGGLVDYICSGPVVAMVRGQQEQRGSRAAAAAVARVGVTMPACILAAISRL
jgi:hypothetical protein